MEPIEIMAGLVAVMALVKIVIIFQNPKQWIKIVKGAYGNQKAMSIGAITLAAISLKFLLEKMTIIHIFAVIFFLTCIMAFTMSFYGREIEHLSTKILKEKDPMKKAGLSIALWVVLSLWALYELIF